MINNINEKFYKALNKTPYKEYENIKTECYNIAQGYYNRYVLGDKATYIELIEEPVLVAEQLLIILKANGYKPFIVNNIVFINYFR